MDNFKTAICELLERFGEFDKGVDLSLEAIVERFPTNRVGTTGSVFAFQLLSTSYIRGGIFPTGRYAPTFIESHRAEGPHEIRNIATFIPDMSKVTGMKAITLHPPQGRLYSIPFEESRGIKREVADALQDRYSDFPGLDASLNAAVPADQIDLPANFKLEYLLDKSGVRNVVHHLDEERDAWIESGGDTMAQHPGRHDQNHP